MDASPERTTADVDVEIRRIIEECQQNAIRLLEENRVAPDKISTYLLEKENMSGEEWFLTSAWAMDYCAGS